MGRYERHLRLYERLKEDGLTKDLHEETATEALFLAAFHLIDACAALQGVHIGKHQRVRADLEANRFIFGERTEEVWRLFNELERDLRPRFAYGFSWTPEDFARVREAFAALEAICGEVLK
ncbi:MAG: hypothetical protein ACE5JE_09655 [Thermoplasmata archaeon]